VVHLLLILFCSLVLNAQDVRLQVVTTSGLQGRVLSQNPFTLQPEGLGWAAVSTVVRNLKAQNPNTLLVDCGNTLSGDPMNYLRNRIRPDLPDPSVAIMNALGYHAMTVGRREYDFGFKILRGIEDLAQFPFLSANTVFTSTGKGVFTPYVKVALEGIQVVILGLTAASTPRGIDPSNLLDITFLDPVETARSLIPKLRDKEKADVVIVALHGALGKGPCDPLGPEPIQCLAEKVPGIDLIIAGNMAPGQFSRAANVPVLQTGPLGQAVGVADLTLRKERFHWKVQNAQLRLEQPRHETPLDSQALNLTASLRTETEAYLDTYATNLMVDLDGRWSRMEDTPLVQLLHTVLRRTTGAQLTAAPSPGSRIYIPKGPTSVRQFFALAPDEDRIARIRITGAQLRRYLEHSARFYNLSYQPDLYNRDMDPRDFDMVSGLNYRLDLGKPVGQRVASLTYRDETVKDDQTFTLALMASRLSGKGGFREAAGLPAVPEMVSAMSLRNALLDYVLAKPTLTVATTDNWRTIPYLDRERVLRQQP
jgi:2',3'-cyclic-nucleotide 2'-phosphodiesterase/3'-nucleotidase